MATFVRGSASINLVFSKSDGDQAEFDRQYAWELYNQLMARISLRGQIDEQGEDRFRGEVLADSFTELETFLEETKRLAIRYPQQLAEGRNNHLALFVLQIQEYVVRPFLIRWQAEFRYWWEQNRHHGEPFVIQNNYPALDAMLDDWIAIRRFGRATLSELATTYAFVDVASTISTVQRQMWE